MRDFFFYRRKFYKKLKNRDFKRYNYIIICELLNTLYITR